MMAKGMFVDTSVCIGCKACQVACKQWNELGEEPSHFEYEAGVASKAIWLQSGFVLAYNSGLGYGSITTEQIIYRIDPAHPAEAAKIATIPQPARIVTMQAVVAVRARLILGSSLIGPRALNVADMLTTTGAITAVGSGGFMVTPVLSPDGRFVAGQTHVGGALTIRDMQTGKQVVLTAPPQISSFSWLY